MHTWMCVAEIVKAKTLHGGLVVRSAAGLPFLLAEGMKVSFVPPQFDCPRSATVVSVSSFSQNNNYVVEFDSVSDRDTAERLAGCSCLIKAGDFDVSILEQQDDSLIQYRVVDEVHGELGVVRDIEANSWQDLLVVEGDKGIIYIPYVEEFVCQEDESNRILKTKIPDGLIELAQNKTVKEERD